MAKVSIAENLEDEILKKFKEESKIKEEYGHDLNAVRRVQVYCFIVAAFVSYYLTWGYK